MIEDVRSIAAGTTLDADLCIIGGGPAAICLALDFMDSGKAVIVLPGGGTHQNAACIDLYRGRVSPPGSHEPLEENRLRMWGGTTTVWGGRCVPFDPIDLAHRSWVNGSDWPIEYDEIRPYMARACALSEAGDPDFDARSVFPTTQGEILKGFDNTDLVSWPLERWSPPTDFSQRYKGELSSASNVRVFLNAHALHLQLDDQGRELQFVTAACEPGKSFRVCAANFVLACGALENTRLLLASNDVCPHGIGNDHDLVGRFYQSHLFGVCGTVELKDPMKDFVYAFERDSEGIYCRRRFWLTPEAQEKFQVGNVVGFFFRNVSGSSEHRNAMVSLVMLVKTLLGGAKKGPRRLLNILKTQHREILTHLGIVLKDAPSLFSQVGAVAYTRFFQKRRLPMILPDIKSNRFALFYQAEHIPNRESRVLLDPSDHDDFGLPRLNVQIKFCEQDFRSITVFVETFKQRLESLGMGKLHLNEEERQFLKTPRFKKFNSNSHNIGTTRMSSQPELGVVDPNCRVHSVGNLYVAGSSVFPTSSHANPTLMIIALALRLSDHLKEKTAQ